MSFYVIIYYVINMNEEREYYEKIIKPIEKNYTKMCNLYAIFKLNYFKNQRNFYNKILICYYRSIIINNKLNKLFDNN